MNAFIERILKLNNDFYQSTAQEFSATRQKGWNGWERTVPHIQKLGKGDILDLGCGNGRYLAFLQEKGIGKGFKYTGYDLSQILLSEAKKVRSIVPATFECLNIFDIKNLSAVQEKFDIVVAFGVTHHIPSEALRKEWFSAVGKIIKKNGLLIVTFWDFSELKKEKIKDNDFMLGWNNSNVQRFCHLYTDPEKSDIISILNKEGFEQVERYFDDGRNGRMNEYIIMKRTYETTE